MQHIVVSEGSTGHFIDNDIGRKCTTMRNQQEPIQYYGVQSYFLSRNKKACGGGGTSRGQRTYSHDIKPRYPSQGDEQLFTEPHFVPAEIQ